jgi:N-acetylneuraminic acid mutarotase
MSEDARRTAPSRQGLLPSRRVLAVHLQGVPSFPGRNTMTPSGILWFAIVALLQWVPAADAQVTPAVGGSWATRAPLPEPRTEVSVAADGRQIFVVGGFAPGASGQGWTAPRSMYAYDPSSDRWSSVATIVEGVNHSALVHVDGKLYVVGGFRETSRQPTGAVHIYDLASRQWSAGAPMLTPRGALAVVVLDRKIHALGGNAANAQELGAHDHRVGGDASSVGTHEVYDPATNTWTRRAPMPTPRNHHAAAVLQGRIHAVGGRVGGDFTMTTHEIYDPTRDAWTAAPPLPTGRSGIAAVALDGRLYVFGGEVFGAIHKTFSEAERYDPRANRWQAMPPMPTARHGLGAAAALGAIHVVAGGPEPGASYSTAHEVLTPAR